MPSSGLAPTFRVSWAGFEALGSAAAFFTAFFVARLMTGPGRRPLVFSVGGGAFAAAGEAVGWGFSSGVLSAVLAAFFAACLGAGAGAGLSAFSVAAFSVAAFSVEGEASSAAGEAAG